MKLILGRWPLIALTICSAAIAQDFTSIQKELFGSQAASANAWADYNDDGWLDLSVITSSGEVRLYRNDHGQFVSVAHLLGLNGNERSGNIPISIAWGDYDRDGDIDLYVGSLIPHGVPLSRLSRNYLYRNDGDHGFVEIASKAGVELLGADTRQASWIDYDNDGDLDLFVAQRSGYNRLFRNEGGEFSDVSASVGLFDPRRTVGACWFDMDQDGDLDLFLANQNGDKDALYRNDNGKFKDVAADKEMDQPSRALSEGGVGCSVGDFNGDGTLDLFVATYGRNLLYQNDGAGNFKEISQQMGVVGNSHSVGASWADYDNDGRLDLYVSGYRPAGGSPHNYLYRNSDHTFTNVLSEMSPLNVADHGVQWADYDRDGDLDISLTGSFSPTSGHKVLRNELMKEHRNRSFQVLVLDQDGRFTRAGAEVRLYDSQKRIIGTRMVPTGDGYNSQSAMPVHFGLQRAQPVTVEVTFLTMAGRRLQKQIHIDTKKYLGKVLTVIQEPL